MDRMEGEDVRHMHGMLGRRSEQVAGGVGWRCQAGGAGGVWLGKWKGR